jgi:LmbE family N-acetylglucosaminyl deacetylase
MACHHGSVIARAPIAETTPMLDALIVAPHPDDAELGLGGTIARLIASGWQVGILDLTSGEPAAPRRPRRMKPWAIPGGRTWDYPIAILSRP